MNLGSLVSETRNPQTMDLDALSTLELVNRFNQQDTLVALAVKETLPEVAKAVDAAAAALKAGGRIIYMGAGTSGRLGVLDASECPPTFGVPHGLVVGLIAGGPGALLKAVEGAEDSKQLGEDDLKALNLTAQDLVVGLAASGRTPYVIGGLEYARQTGCTTVAISCNPGSPIAQVADIAISPVVGPEALTGSTRLKSGNRTKTGTEYDLYRRDGEIWQGLPEPDGGYEGHQREAGGQSVSHGGGSHRDKPRGGGKGTQADGLRCETGHPDDIKRAGCSRRTSQP